MKGKLICARTGVLLLLLLWVVWGGPSSVCFAQSKTDNAEIMKMLDRMENTIKQQQQEIDRLKKELTNVKEGQEKVQKVQEQTIQKQVKQEVDQQFKPLAWAKNIKLSGDLRLRYEGIYDREKNDKDLESRDRFRVRLRLYADSQVTDEIGAHVMLTTSEGQLGQTSNQSLGTEFDNKAIYIGRMYADYKPKWLPDLELGFGKYKNPFYHSDITWDPDVNPEGFYELYTYKGWKTVQPFLRFGQNMISENNLTKDGSLFLWQGGATLNFNKVQLTLAGSYYDYMNLDRTRLGDSDRSKGNTVVDDPDNSGKKILAYDFRVAEAMANLQFNVYKIPVSIWGDYLKNTAGDVPSDRDTAWGVGLSVGQTVEPGDWLFEYMYKRIESDSVLGLFADGDFFGTDRRGHRFMVMYQLFKKVTLELKLFDTEAIKADDSEIRLQVSTIFKF